jgi:hypothetical protein
MVEGEKTSKKREESRRNLPEDLRTVFDELVLDYQAAAMTHHRMPFVSYVVLADVVRAGWRRTAEPRYS